MREMFLEKAQLGANLIRLSEIGAEVKMAHGIAREGIVTVG